MTTGNKTIDLRSAPVSTDSGLARPGYYWLRTWSGSDSPATPPVYTVLRVPARPERVYGVYRWHKTKRGFLKKLPASQELVYRIHTDRRRVLEYKVTIPSRDGYVIKHPIKSPKRGRAYLPHAYTVTTYFYYDPLMLWKWTGTPPANNKTGTMAAQFGITEQNRPLDVLNSNDTLGLLGKLREKVAGSDFNASVFLGTQHQTLRLITGNTLKIASALRHARRGDFAKASRVLTGKAHMPVSGSFGTSKVIAQNWLELQYGWLPLLADVHDGAQMLAHHLNAPMQFRVVVTRFRKVTGLGVNPYVSGGYFPPNREIMHRKRILAILSEPPSVVQLSGLLDPWSLAWELLPWSFVVDWFIPIGNYLEQRGLATALSGTFVTSEKLQSKFSFDGGYQGVSKASAGGPFYANSAFRSEYTYFNRSVSTTLSIPKPSFKPLGMAASWKHCVNAVALLVSQGRSDPRSML